MGVSKRTSLVLCLVLCLALVFTASAFAQPSDMQGHWAKQQVEEWVDSGLASGYPDGTFKPNNNITRAEFVALVNRAFDKQDAEAAADYSDVAPSNWFYAEVAAATAAGYVGGYQDGTFKPQNAISRQEAASLTARLLGLSGDAAAASFTDADAVGAWAKEAVNAVAEAGIMNGYEDGSFGPQRSITRAEAVVTLDRARGWTPLPAVYDEAGAYGPQTGVRTINNTVTVETAGVILQNLVIKGDLIVAAGVGDGDVTLNNVTVEGTTYIRGGGTDSVYINGGKYGAVVVEKATAGGVRIVAKDVEGVAVTVAEAAKGQEVVLEGEFKSVTVQADGVKLSVAKDAKVEELKVEKGLKDIKVDVAEGSEIKEFVKDSKVVQTGEGTIRKTSGEYGDQVGAGGGLTATEKAVNAFNNAAQQIDELKAHDGTKIAVKFNPAKNEIVVSLVGDSVELKANLMIAEIRGTGLFADILPNKLGVKKIIKVNDETKDIDITNSKEAYEALKVYYGEELSDIRFTAVIQPKGHDVVFEQDFTLKFEIED